MDAVSPFAPADYPDFPSVEGVRFATEAAGIKYQGRTDVLLTLFDPGTEVAGVFTTSRCPSAPVEWCRAHLAGGKARALVVNSGNANAFTGMKGRNTVKATADFAAEAVGCAPEEVFLASTGVIGEPMDPAPFGQVLKGMTQAASDNRLLDAARAIMTTDTFPKAASRTVGIGGVPVTITGIAKGAGMIAPDMATMLSFIFTDAPVSAKALQAMLSKGVKDTFNAITVDSDTSTSDTVMLFATGKAADRGAPRIEEAGDRKLSGFKKALNDLLRELSHSVVKDGEGLRKFVEVQVTGATSKASARKIGKSIADSPLVKTAVAGEDANWGRVVMAVGKAGESADRDKLAIWFGDIRVAVGGERDPDYSEDAASAYMQNAEIVIRVDLGLGRGRDTVWTCDLTKEYVAINGDYRS